MVFAHSAIVLAERDIKHPVQTVLDAPVVACSLGKGFGTHDALATDVESTFGGNSAADLPLPFDHPDSSEFWPVFALILVQPGQVGDPHRLPRFDPAMIFINALVAAER